jgi:5'-3' exonuclease
MVKKVMKKTITETLNDDGSVKTTIHEQPEKIVEKKPKEKKMSAREREELLIENFVGLQHAMTNLSIKFGGLSDNIGRLLQIFEESAKNFMEGGRPDDQDLLKKINSLLDQNKTIAKGLVLMESKLRGRAEPESTPQEDSFRQRPKPLPSI